MDTKIYDEPDKGLNIIYISNFLTPAESKKMFDIFEKHIIYNSKEESKILIHGNYRYIPRSQVAYGEPKTFYSFSGITVHTRNWNNRGTLEKILRKLVYKLYEYTGIRFNFVLINRYATGKQYIGYHSDDEKNLDDDICIAGISFGAERTMEFLDRKTNTKYKEIILQSGSLIQLKDPTNKNYKHGIPKEFRCTTPRISLTFRKMKVENDPYKTIQLDRIKVNRQMVKSLQQFCKITDNNELREQLLLIIKKLKVYCIVP